MLKKFLLKCNIILASPTPYETNPKVEINCAEFHVYMFTGFGRVKVHRDTKMYFYGIE